MWLMTDGDGRGDGGGSRRDTPTRHRREIRHIGAQYVNVASKATHDTANKNE
jgi:hypothetical protein